MLGVRAEVSPIVEISAIAGRALQVLRAYETVRPRPVDLRQQIVLRPVHEAEGRFVALLAEYFTNLGGVEMSVDYSGLPIHMQDGARLYVEEGIEPGGFLYRVLCNDLAHAFAQADEVNRDSLPAWAAWLLYELPRSAWGSEEIVNAWLRSGGTRGQLGARSS